MQLSTTEIFNLLTAKFGRYIEHEANGLCKMKEISDDVVKTDDGTEVLPLQEQIDDLESKGLIDRGPDGLYRAVASDKE